MQRITDNFYRNNLLDQLIANYKNQLHLTPILGVEVEFYYLGEAIETLPQSLNIPIKPEKGQKQFEFALGPEDNVEKLVRECRLVINQLQHIGGVFTPKPFANDYGSALHVHVNFMNHHGENIFNDEKTIEGAMQILCEDMEGSFLIFAPYEECYSRFDSKFMAPVNISWGGNNRSTALRIPPGARRIEHRVAAPNCDIALVIYEILFSLYNFLSGHRAPCNLYPKIYGNAFDEQYNLRPFPENIAQASSRINLLLTK